VLVNAATNRLSTSSGYGYDATGNLTSGPGFLYATYDVQNRMATYVPTSGGTEYYSYGPDNMRVWKKPPSGPEEVYFYGARGEKLGRFSYGTGVFTTLRRSIYFGARVVNEGQDRLGSVPDHGGYYPYGEAQTAGFNDQDRFATYYRDGTSLLDYARNRYYSSTVGRFMSADPYRGSMTLESPRSLNRYAYVGDDPVNINDPSGLDPYCGPDGRWMGEGCYMSGGGGPTYDASVPTNTDPYSTVANSQGGQVNTGSNMGNMSPDMTEAYNAYVGSLPWGASGSIAIPIAGICIGSGVCPIAVVIVGGVIISGVAIYGAYELGTWLGPVLMSQVEQRLIDYIARKYCVDRRQLGAAIHAEKMGGPKGRQGDLSRQDIENIAKSLPKIPGCIPQN
jgi:RHS repeat-associated protein